MQYRELWEYKRSVETNKIQLSHFWLGKKRMRGEGGRKQEEEEGRGEEEDQIQVCFVLESWVFGFLRFGMEISCSFV